MAEVGTFQFGTILGGQFQNWSSLSGTLFLVSQELVPLVRIFLYGAHGYFLESYGKVEQAKLGTLSLYYMSTLTYNKHKCLAALQTLDDLGGGKEG